MQCAIAVRCGRWDELLAMTEPQAQTPALRACAVENHSWQIYRIASDILAARIAALSGDKAGAISLLRDAVANQDQLLYDEPADWYYPVRETSVACCCKLAMPRAKFRAVHARCLDCLKLSRVNAATTTHRGSSSSLKQRGRART